MAAKKAVVAMLAVAVVVATSAAAGCNVAQLASCKPAVVGGAKPTAACCSNMRAHQEACLCQYQKDPQYFKYHPSARKMVASCGLPVPNC